MNRRVLFASLAILAALWISVPKTHVEARYNHLGNPAEVTSTRLEHADQEPQK